MDIHIIYKNTPDAIAIIIRKEIKRKPQTKK